MKKSTNIKYTIQKCYVKYHNNIYIINMNYNLLLKKELNYVILKTLKKNKKKLYLYNIKINGKNIISGKNSLENIGSLIEIENIKIVNKYYNKELIIKPEEIINYDISGLTDEKEINIRKYFNKLNYNELLTYNDNIYPIFLILNNYNINIKNIFDTNIIVNKFEPLLINNFYEIKKIKLNFYLKDIEFYFDKNKAIKKNKYNLFVFNKNIKNIKKELLELKNFLIKNNIYNNDYLKNCIIVNFSNLKEEQEYYLNISGFSINDNKLIISNINKIKNSILKVKYKNNSLIYNNNKININNIDNINITLHYTYKDVLKTNYIKLKYLEKFLKEN